jgi:hypothetical protein
MFRRHWSQNLRSCHRRKTPRLDKKKRNEAIHLFLPCRGKNHIPDCSFFCVEHLSHNGKVAERFLMEFLVLPIKNPCGIRASGHTKSKSYTPVAIDENNPILSLESCVHRTYFYARRLVTMHTCGRLPIRSRMIGILHGINLYPTLTWMNMVHMVTCFLTFLRFLHLERSMDHRKFFTRNSNSFFFVRQMRDIRNRL